MREWEKYIRQVEPYVPGEQPSGNKMIKLNTNENPYPPTKEVLKAMEEFSYENLRLYPDPTSFSLVDTIAKYYELDQEEVFVGVGSDDVLAVAFLTFFNSSKPILFPDISYSFYEVWAKLFQIPYEMPLLDKNFCIVREDYYKENGGIVIANPNAPTSIYENLEFIEDILKHNQESIVIIDEAYIDFGGVSARQLLYKYDNLLVVQTFSKSRSMAGMRIGYAMGSKKLIKALNDVKYSYNSYTMNQTSLYYGVKAVEDEEYFMECVNKIITTREYVKEQLSQLGFTYLNSMTNFLFATHESISARELYDSLRKENIYIRYFNRPRIDNYLRISIGTNEEMDKFLEILGKICYQLNM